MSCPSRETEIINRLDTKLTVIVSQTDPNGRATSAAGLRKGRGDVRHPV